VTRERVYQGRERIRINKLQFCTSPPPSYLHRPALDMVMQIGVRKGQRGEGGKGGRGKKKEFTSCSHQQNNHYSLTCS